MIEIEIIGEDYEQDIRPLVKSFYPEDDIVIAGKEEYTEGEVPDKLLELILAPSNK